MKKSPSLPVMLARYLPSRQVREEDFGPPRELEMQALWFEQFYQPLLRTDDGRVVRIIQPGFWNHGGGPDFSRAAVSFVGQDREELKVGNVELHLHATDWNSHGHHADPAYEETLLHVVWHPPVGKTFFPATAQFRRVPQVVLSTQLVAPWAELRNLCSSAMIRPLPGAVPGHCSSALSALPNCRVAEILRHAGMFRLRQKAQRWHWRRQLAGPEQALFEGLAEALGFHANQIPMRLLAQRLPWKKLRSMDREERCAHLFGMAGFLPDESIQRLRTEPKEWLRRLWEIWWKERGPLDYALLSRSQWKLAGLRPLNRPERRIAALAQIVPQLTRLLAAVDRRDTDGFSQILLEIRDLLWEKQATLSGAPLATPCRLIGEERVRDILINLFWPIVSLDDESAALAGLQKLTAPPSGTARLAAQRTLLSALTPKQSREALIQQGLLQIFRDYCQTDCSQCRDCTFPELVRAWPESSASPMP